MVAQKIESTKLISLKNKLLSLSICCSHCLRSSLKRHKFIVVKVCMLHIKISHSFEAKYDNLCVCVWRHAMCVRTDNSVWHDRLCVWCHQYVCTDRQLQTLQQACLWDVYTRTDRPRCVFGGVCVCDVTSMCVQTDHCKHCNKRVYEMCVCVCDVTDVCVWRH